MVNEKPGTKTATLQLDFCVYIVWNLVINRHKVFLFFTHQEKDQPQYYLKSHYRTGHIGILGGEMLDNIFTYATPR